MSPLNMSLSRWVSLLLLTLQLQISAVLANTEKVIFLGPTSLQIPTRHPALEDLRLEVLTPQPQQWSLRTHIQAEFPTNTSNHGYASWFLLDQLKEGQRYEVRVCWAATQPTAFRLNAYELPKVFETPELIASLAQYSETRQSSSKDAADERPRVYSRGKHEAQHTSDDDVSSILLLEVLAAADYYTMNKTLMSHVPPVFVDVILDPFILNVFPRSLVPTAGYVLLLAVGSWYLSAYISRWFVDVSSEEASIEKKKT